MTVYPKPSPDRTAAIATLPGECLLTTLAMIDAWRSINVPLIDPSDYADVGLSDRVNQLDLRVTKGCASGGPRDIMVDFYNGLQRGTDSDVHDSAGPIDETARTCSPPF